MNQPGIELDWIFLAIRRWLWLVVGCVVLAVVVAYFATANLRPTYEAAITLLVQPAPDARSSEYNALVAGERLALTYTEMLQGNSVLEKVISENQLAQSAAQLSKKVTVQPVRDTQLIRVTVEDSSADQAVLVANAIGQAFISHIQALQMERYARPLENLQAKMETLASQIGEAQSKIQALNIQKISNDARQTELESLLITDYNSYQQLQTSYQTLQLNSESPLSRGVSIVEPARPANGDSNSAATVTFLADQSAPDGAGNYSSETYARMLASSSVLEATITRLGLDISPSMLAQRVSVNTIPQTQLFQLTVLDYSTIDQALLLADTIAEVFVEQLDAMHQQPYADRMSSLQDQIDDVEKQIGTTQAELAALAGDQVKVGIEITNLENQLVWYNNDYRTLQQDQNEMQMMVTNATDAVVVAEPARGAKEADQKRWLYIALAAVVTAVLVGAGSLVVESFKRSK